MWLSCPSSASLSFCLCVCHFVLVPKTDIFLNQTSYKIISWKWGIQSSSWTMVWPWHHYSLLQRNGWWFHQFSYTEKKVKVIIFTPWIWYDKGLQNSFIHLCFKEIDITFTPNCINTTYNKNCRKHFYRVLIFWPSLWPWTFSFIWLSVHFMNSL